MDVIHVPFEGYRWSETWFVSQIDPFCEADDCCGPISGTGAFSKPLIAANNMTALDLDKEGTAKLLSFTEELARKAGAMIRTAFHSQVGKYERKSATDPVTETDHAVEAMFFRAIREKYPSHSLIGEESASGVEWTDAPTWILDPIDGTANCTLRPPGCAVLQQSLCKAR